MWALHLRLPGSRVQAHQSWRTGLAAARHVGSSHTRGWTCVSYVGSRFFTTETRVCVCVCVCPKSPQSCPTLCNPVDCSLPGSSVHGILQARILEWGAISFSRGTSPPRDGTLSLPSPALAGRFFTTSATWEVLTPGKPSNFFFWMCNWCTKL